MPPFPCPARSGAQGTGLIRSSHDPFPSPIPRPPKAGESDWPRRDPSRVANPAHNAQHHGQRSADRTTPTRVFCAAQIPPACSAGMTTRVGSCVRCCRSLTSFSGASGDLLRVALIAPGPGSAATTPPWGDAASPVGPGYTFLADDGSLTGQRAAGAPLTHPQIPQRLPPPSMSGVPFLWPSSSVEITRVHSTTAPGYHGHREPRVSSRTAELVAQASGGPLVHLQSS